MIIDGHTSNPDGTDIEAMNMAKELFKSEDASRDKTSEGLDEFVIT